MSIKNAKKSEQRKSNQQQDGAQASQSKQHNQPPVQGEQPQPPQTQNQPPQAQPEQQAQPAAALPSQTFRIKLLSMLFLIIRKKEQSLDSLLLMELAYSSQWVLLLNF